MTRGARRPEGDVPGRTPFPGHRIRPRRWGLFPALPGLLAVLLLTAACGGGSEGTPGREAGGAAGGEAAGVPVTEPAGPVDGALAIRGEATFKARGCVACHTVGKGRLVGPDLLNVTERRSFAWFYRMVTNPDSMTRNDSVARQLLAEYLTPMLNQNVQPEEVPALWDFLRRESLEHGSRAGGDPGSR